MFSEQVLHLFLGKLKKTPTSNIFFDNKKHFYSQICYTEEEGERFVPGEGYNACK